ncbi:pyridoxal-phosphate dependent enzyme [Actinoallomurus purpureus]|uniref:pyridoxal-phosphate dependent enzyme n=1 Tax=Actinoallomurus purpureus TaxID=478114 RepID=UPI002093DCD1|nr:pyridoxal-phosphate dependent enzyme [Actinoallomurus purpureus]MCO6009892.1 pyridoxal-phosphate dependent enzyme [Actinoallomurus purpureus]
MADAGAGPTFPLGSWPTPLEEAPRLAAAIGLAPGDLWIKRDDLSGLGGGGNKVRKLEWTIGDAIAQGADTVVTTGAPQSNHARLTAAAAARAGLDAVLVLAGRPERAGSGNLALAGLFGARVVWAGDVTHEDLAEAAREVAGDLRAAGAVPALIPFGGSSVLSARGYVECGRELLRQAPDLHDVVVAVGSGGTMAGLVAALGAERVLGVDCGALDDPAPVVAALAAPVGPVAVEAGRLRIRREQVGAGYGELTEPVARALDIAGHTEGIPLDPIYTGRALAGLIAAVADGSVAPGRKTIFLHSGGLPGLFGHPGAVAHAEAGLHAMPPRS